MSGALPNTDFTAINIKSNQRTLVSETDSGKTFRRQIQGQRWSFTIKYPSMTRADFAPTMAFMIKQRSQKESFTVTFPSYLNALGNESGTLLVNGAHSVADTTSSSNACTVTIEPPLTTALANDSSVTYDSIPFTVHMTSDVQEFNTGAIDSSGNLLFSYEFDVIEAI